MSVTQKQIADRLGLSQMTVSYALRGSQLVADDTREQVQAAAREMGYRLNSSARAIRKGRCGCVAILESTAQYRSSFFGGALFDGIHDALAARDIHVTVAKLPDHFLTDEEYVPKILREFMADGILINYFADIPPRLIELIDRYEMPAVWINSRQAHDCVYLDDYRGGREAAERLIALGHKRIGYADYGHYRPPSLAPDKAVHYSIIDRFLGYRDAMTEYDCTPLDLNPTGHIRGEAVIPCIREWLNKPDRPTAVICYGRRTATQLLHIAGSQGFRVPDDLSLLMFANTTSTELGIPLDTMEHGWEHMGRTASEMLLAKIDNPTRRLPSRPLRFHYRNAGTIAPPSANPE